MSPKWKIPNDYVTVQRAQNTATPLAHGRFGHCRCNPSDGQDSVWSAGGPGEEETVSFIWMK